MKKNKLEKTLQDFYEIDKTEYKKECRHNNVDYENDMIDEGVYATVMVYCLDCGKTLSVPELAEFREG